MIHVNPFTPTRNCIEKTTGFKDVATRSKTLWAIDILLLRNGYSHIEGDAYGKKETSKNQQLSKALDNGNYLGIGLSAVSYNTHFRYINTNNPADYFRAVGNGVLPYAFLRKLEYEDNARLYCIQNMRYGKINIQEFWRRFNTNIFDIFAQELDLLNERFPYMIGSSHIYFDFKQDSDYFIASKFFYSANILNELYDLYTIRHAT